jgi:hypothetical protein
MWTAEEKQDPGMVRKQDALEWMKQQELRRTVVTWSINDWSIIREAFMQYFYEPSEEHVMQLETLKDCFPIPVRQLLELNNCEHIY